MNENFEKIFLKNEEKSNKAETLVSPRLKRKIDQTPVELSSDEDLTNKTFC